MPSTANPFAASWQKAVDFAKARMQTPGEPENWVVCAVFDALKQPTPAKLATKVFEYEVFVRHVTQQYNESFEEVINRLCVNGWRLAGVTAVEIVLEREIL